MDNVNQNDKVPVITTSSEDGDMISTLLLMFYEKLDKLAKEGKHHE